MTRILFISKRFHTNETEMVRQLIDNSYEIEYIVNESKYTEDHTDIQPIVVGYSSSQRWLKNDFQRTKFGFYPFSIFNKIRKISPDIIIIKGFRYSTLYLSLMLKAYGFKVVINVQKPLISKKESIMKILYYRLFGKQVITPVYRIASHANENLKNRNSFMLGQTWTYLPFITSVKTPSVSREYFKDNKINILIVAKYTQRKKIIECLNVLDNLYTEFQDIHVTVIGSVLDNNVYNQVKLIENEKTYLTVLKDVPYNEMQHYYKNNDVFVMPSIQESASYSQLEAMSFGLCIVCCDDNGTADYVKHNYNGLIFEHNNYSESLHKELRKILKNKEQLIDMGKNSIDLVSKNHNIEKIINFLKSSLEC